VHFSSAPCVLHAPDSQSWFDCPGIWWRVQIIVLIIVQFSPVSCHLFPLRLKCSRHAVLWHQFVFSLYMRTSFTVIQNSRLNYSFFILINMFCLVNISLRASDLLDRFWKQNHTSVHDTRM
jgi:hypothetical protein